LFPFASAWNRAADALTPASLVALFRKHNFEPGAVNWHLPETQVEESAGLGFGITIQIGLSLVIISFGRGKMKEPKIARSDEFVQRLVCLAQWLRLFYVMTKLSLSGSVRYLAAYYPLLCAGLLRSPRNAGLVRQTWWRGWAYFSCGLAGLVLIVSPARPLWPAGWFFKRYGARLQSSQFGARAMDAYGAKRRRSEVFAPVVTALPPDATLLGFSADDFPETSLWKPFGSRRILHVKANDSAEELRQRGLRYLLVVSEKLNEPWPQWLQQMDARELQSITLKMWGSLPPFHWHLVELRPGNAGQSHTEISPDSN